MNYKLGHVPFAFLLATGCDKGATQIGDFDDGGACVDAQTTAGASDDGTDAEPVPLAVDCSFHWDGVTQGVRYSAQGQDDDTGAVLTIGPFLVSADLSEHEAEGRTFSISVFQPDDVVGSTVLYQIGTLADVPKNEFWGDHGFTGLNWVKDPASGDNLQYACVASDPDDPIHVWED
jgi:hypothetical protein